MCAGLAGPGGAECLDQLGLTGRLPGEGRGVSRAGPDALHWCLCVPAASRVLQRSWITCRAS